MLVCSVCYRLLLFMQLADVLCWDIVLRESDEDAAVKDLTEDSDNTDWQSNLPKDCPSIINAWIPGCGIVVKPGLPEGWVKKFIEYEMRERRYLVVVREEVNEDARVFPGVLLSEYVALAVCANFHKLDSGHKRERDISVTRAITGEIRTHVPTAFELITPCNFATNDIFIDPVVLELGMARVPRLKVLYNDDEFSTDDICRFYSFYVDQEAWTDDVYVALQFIPKDPVCANYSRPNSLCGMVFDPEQKFCSLAPGGPVFCRRKLLGIARSACVPSTKYAYVNKTRFALIAVRINHADRKRWISLGRNLHRIRHNQRAAGPCWERNAFMIYTCILACIKLHSLEWL